MNSYKSGSGGASRPEDELFAEFQGYVQTLYAEASAPSMKKLDDSIRRAVEKLGAGIRGALGAVDDKSGQLESLFESTRQNFQGQFGPLLDDHIQRMEQGHRRFVDGVAERAVRELRGELQSFRAECLALVRQGEETARQASDKAYRQAGQRGAETKALLQETLDEVRARHAELADDFTRMRDRADRKFTEMERANRSCLQGLPGMAAQAADEAGRLTVSVLKPFLYFTSAMGFLGLAAGCLAVTLLLTR